MTCHLRADLLYKKYDVQAPRYTSYPTVPFWQASEMKEIDWRNSVMKGAKSESDQGISLYIHLPFCESLCTFCGCHKHITKRHEVEQPYIETVLKEWQLYLELFEGKPKLSELHLGGGTPTFFSPTRLHRLISTILKSCDVAENCEMSFEGHPNNTSASHLTVLHELGFTRVSFGVQDYDPTVQQAINRIQSFETVKTAHEHAKRIGYTSVSHDLVFGLPFQTMAKMEDSVLKTLELRPERISLYSYAHVPWVKGVGQRGYDESSLPKKQEKRALYDRAKRMLLENGYEEIGMDHFALPSDSMAIAERSGQLNRNFMGYTTTNTNMIIGLGMSAISDSWFGYAQNVKSVSEYQERVEKGKIPVFRGHFQSDEDMLLRQQILNLMCAYQTDLATSQLLMEQVHQILEKLAPLEQDLLVKIDGYKIAVTEVGKIFIRNICMCFDAYLAAKEPSKKMFSTSV